MSGRGRQGDWTDYSTRARQPRSGGDAIRGYRQPGARMPQSGRERAPNGGRSRFVAVLVLAVTAVVVAIGGLAAAEGDIGDGAGATVSISLLPLPQNTSTTVTQ